MNSGLVDATRYNDTIFDSLAAIKVQPTLIVSLQAQLDCTSSMGRQLQT